MVLLFRTLWYSQTPLAIPNYLLNIQMDAQHQYYSDKQRKLHFKRHFLSPEI